MKLTDMEIVGLTGGVGAGKSTVLAFLEGQDGVRTVQADAVGHMVMEPGMPACEKICGHFGGGIRNEETGQINRAALAERIFSDEQEKVWLEQLIHPAVKAWIRRDIEAARERGDCRLYVIEAALLIEDHYEEICKEFWYLYADQEVRRARLKASRGYSDEKINGIFASQLPDSQFRAHCREVIDNSRSQEETISQVKELLRKHGFGSSTIEKECTHE